MTQLLWRIEGQSAAPNVAGWQQGLTLHLLFQSLTTIIARREGGVRRYLALAGCPSCGPEGCERLCHRMLFAQLVRITLPGVTLVPTPRLTPRPTETTRVLATPQRPDARLLDAAFLAQWEEGRLALTWSGLRAQARPISVGARIAVGAAGPDLRRALRDYGWKVHGLASRVSRAAFAAAVPAAVPVAGRAGEALFHALRDPRRLTADAGIADSEA